MQAQRDISQTDSVRVRVVFQSNKNTEGQRFWYKIHSRHNNCQGQNKKSQTGCQIQWWRSHHHSIKQARWFVREKGGEAMEEAEGEQRGAAFQVPGQGRHTQRIRLKQQYKDLQKKLNTWAWERKVERGKMYAMLRSWDFILVAKETWKVFAFWQHWNINNRLLGGETDGQGINRKLWQWHRQKMLVTRTGMVAWGWG